MPHLVENKKQKDQRGSPKLRTQVYREIAQFAASQGLTIAGVVENAWDEYKVANGITIPPVSFHPGQLSKKKGA